MLQGGIPDAPLDTHMKNEEIRGEAVIQPKRRVEEKGSHDVNDPSKEKRVSEPRKRKIVTLPIAGKSAPVIPVPQSSEWLDLLFPAHVINTETALSHISPAITADTTDVALNFRPRNPSSIPLRSKVQPVARLILKVNRKTKAVRVIGKVHKAVEFNKLADFQLQYPPPPPTPNYCNVVSPLIDFRYISKDKHAIRVNSDCHSVRNTPFDYFYQNGEAVSSKSGEVKVRPARPSIVIHWKSTDSEIPTTPMKDVGGNVYKQNYVNEYKDKIEEMFRSRPIWTTAAFANVIELREVPLRVQLLPHFAFYANTGPWRGMWIKYGYDPRTNTINRKYQLIDFRAPRLLQAKSAIQRFSVKKGHNSSLGKPESDEIEASAAGMACHVYKSDKLPFKRQSHYQVCDIQDSRCQAVLKSFETDIFTHEDGFYGKGAIHAVRKLMTEQFKDFLKKRKESSADMKDDDLS